MEMKRVAIGDLEGAALDWAVNVAQSGANGTGMKEMTERLCLTSGSLFRPSRDWSQAGPLMVRYEITVTKADGAGFCAGTNATGVAWGCIGMQNPQDGDTYIQAALRAIVASHNPEGYVEVPVELLEVA